MDRAAAAWRQQGPAVQAAISRALVLACMAVMDWLIPDYDSSSGSGTQALAKCIAQEVTLSFEPPASPRSVASRVNGRFRWLQARNLSGPMPIRLEHTGFSWSSWVASGCSVSLHAFFRL